MRSGRRWLLLAVAIVAGMGLTALRLLLHDVSPAALRAAARAVPPGRIALAVALTTASYGALTLCEHGALRAIGRPLPWRVSAIGAVSGYAIGYNLGLSLLTGGSARLRSYRAAGLGMREVTQIGALGSVAFWIGVALTAGLALAGGATGPGGRWAGVPLIGVALLPLVLRASGRRRVGRGRWTLPLPDGWALLRLALASLVDLLTASAALFVLLPGTSAAAFPAFFVRYALAIVVALVSHVPGGLGVFETVVLAATPGDRSAVFAGLLLYRVIYYLLPLAGVALVLAVAEARRLRRPVASGLTLAGRVGRALAPGAVTLLVFGSGLVLLLSGAVPGVGGRLGDLDALLPLPFVEVSHLGGSLVGTALLLVAPALHARLRSGLIAARPLLVAGALFSLGKGLDWEEALVQLGALAVLHYGRVNFYRTGGLATEAPDARWLLAAAGALGLSVWAGLFAYARVPYSDALWWRFALDGDAPRFLRATFAAGILLACAAGWHLLFGRGRVKAGAVLPPEVAQRALAVAPRTDAQLAFTGDKRFVVAASGDAFLMYRVEGRSWVVMGDPVGAVAAWPDLIWRIRQMCDAAHGRLVLYQVSAAMLPLTVELGLDVMKYGEEALVDLHAFSLAGPRAKDWRHALRRTEAAGLSFAVVPAAAVPALLPALRDVSDAWLLGKTGREKRFSVGPFDPDYLTRFPCAVVRQSERVIAFANVWTSVAGAELSVDLMRHRPDAPAGTMDMLFARLLLWGQGEGYRWFNLGIAPLAGLPRGRLAPVWAKIGHTVFARGERFYGFTGLRAFKAKFSPHWQPRYIARPRGIAGLRALVGLIKAVNG